MRDTNTEHGRINRGLILCFRASQMDDSSGDDWFSKFRAEKPVEMTVTVSNTGHHRELRALQRSHRERVCRHRRHRGHVPSARRGLFSREVRVRIPSARRGRSVGLSREDPVARPEKQDCGPEVGVMYTLRGTLLAVEERANKPDSWSGVTEVQERSQATHQGYEQGERFTVESRQEGGMPDGIGRSAVDTNIVGIDPGGLGVRVWGIRESVCGQRVSSVRGCIFQQPGRFLRGRWSPRGSQNELTKGMNPMGDGGWLWLLRPGIG